MKKVLFAALLTALVGVLAGCGDDKGKGGANSAKGIATTLQAAPMGGGPTVPK